MSRSYHHKSRNGCGQCKRRRVRCSMQGPRCHHCKRRGEQCDFELRDRDIDQTRQLWLGPRDHSNQTSMRQYVSSTPMQNVGLIGHFAEVTAPFIALTPEATWVWSLEVPAAAEKSDFLRHGVSALTILHMAELSSLPSPELRPLVFHHYAEAISHFRGSVSSLTEENCVAVFAFSLIVIMVQLKTATYDTCGTTPPLFQPADAMHAIRGAYELIQILGPYLIQSRIASVFFRNVFSPAQPLNQDTANALDNLATVSSSTGTKKDRETYTQAVGCLQYWFFHFKARRRGWLPLAWWPSAVTPAYITQLKQSQPIPLIIFLHWCVGVQSHFQAWFLRDYARQAALFVQDRLHPTWRHMIEYPLKELGLASMK